MDDTREDIRRRIASCEAAIKETHKIPRRRLDHYMRRARASSILFYQGDIRRYQEMLEDEAKLAAFNARRRLAPINLVAQAALQEVTVMLTSLRAAEARCQEE